MARAADLIAQLTNVLPRVTDLFSDSVSVTSLTRVGSTVTAVTATPHNYTTGDYVNIVGAQAPVEISSLTRIGRIATGLTVQPHDLTDGYQTTVKVTGADQPEYNGDALPFLHQENRNTFTYTVEGSPVSPATGDPLLLFDGKERGYNGRFPVTVLDANTFTYQIATTPYTPALGTITARGRVRVSGAITIDRIIEAYTAQAPNKMWAFVVPGNTDTSKDRNILNDGVAMAAPGMEFKLRIIENFSIAVICPSTNEIAALAVTDLMKLVRIALFRSLVRFNPQTDLSVQSLFGIIFSGDSLHAYNDAFVIHEFKFQEQEDVTYGDTIDPDVNVAFRDILFSLQNSPNTPFNGLVDLDDKP